MSTTMPEAVADIALIGLAVMGQNIILNMNDLGFVVCAFNRTVSKVDDFLALEAKGTKIIGAKSLEDMVKKLKKPCRVMLLVKVIFLETCLYNFQIFHDEFRFFMNIPKLIFKAGSAVDAFIEALTPLLEPGDIIIDG